MAAPTITSVVVPGTQALPSNNGGPAAGGYKATITGTNLTGAKAVRFGNNEATEVKVESATEIVCKVPGNAAAFTGVNNAGYVNVTATTAEGTSAEAEANIFVYWAPSSVSVSGNTTVEKVPVGKVKGATAATEPVSYLKVAGAETKFIVLNGNYGQYLSDYIVVESDVKESTGTPKLVVSLEHSLDGGVSWQALPAATAVAEQTGTGILKVETSQKEKPHGNLLRLSLALGAAGGVAGTVTVQVTHA